MRWLRILSTARIFLGLPEEEFWEMGPGYYAALHKAKLEEIQVFDEMQARISAMIASSIPTKKKKKIKPSDYRIFPLKPKGTRGSPGSLFSKFKAVMGVK